MYVQQYLAAATCVAIRTDCAQSVHAVKAKWDMDPAMRHVIVGNWVWGFVLTKDPSAIRNVAAMPTYTSIMLMRVAVLTWRQNVPCP